MGVFLIIAVFFNNPALLNFSNPSTNSLSNFTVQTGCQNQKIEQNCFGNFSSTDNSNMVFTNNSSNSFQIKCEKTPSNSNCTSNLSSNEISKTPNQQTNDKLTKFFSFLSSVLFLVIGCVVLFDAFTYIRIYKHSKSDNKKRAIIEVIKDLTIFLFIIPFAYLLMFFVILVSNSFGEFLATGLLIFYITVYIAEIIVVMFLMLRYLFSLKGNREKERLFSGICLVLGLVSGAIFWFILPEIINFTFSISMAFILMSIIAFFRPYIERQQEP